MTYSQDFVFITILSFLVLQTVSSTDLGNSCELQGQYLSNTNKLKVTVTGTTVTFADDVLNLPGLFNVTATSSKVLDSDTKFLSTGKYILIADDICFSISFIDHQELVIYRRNTNNKEENCVTFITDDEMKLKENLIFDGLLIDGTQMFCGYYIYGAMVAAVGSFCATLGMNLQKLTHDKLEKQNDRVSKYYTQPLWIIGMSLIVLDAILDVATFALAPAALLAPLASLVLIHNVFIAPCLLKEKVDKKSLVATAIIIGGSLLATFMAPKKTPILSPDYFISRWTSTPMIVFESCVVFIFFTSYFYITNIVKRRTVTKKCVDVDVELLRKVSSSSQAGKEEFPSIDDAINDAIDSKDIGLTLSSDDTDETYEDLELVEGEFDYTVVRFGYSFLSGLLGGQSIIFAKTVIELVKVTFFGKDQGIIYMCFASIDFYIYLLSMIAVLVAQTNVLNFGLKYFEAIKIVPVFITFYQIFGVIGGGLYYEEFNEFELKHWILFPVGCFISFCGIYILSMKPGALCDSDNDVDKENLNSDDDTNREDRLSRNFRTSVHLPLLGRGDSEPIEISKGRKSLVGSLRWSLTSEDISVINKRKSSGATRAVSDPTGIAISEINKSRGAK